MDKVKWGEYRIEDVLNWQPQKEIDPLKLKLLKDETENSYPFYGQAILNNGIISYNQLTNKVLNNKHGKPTILIHSNNQNIVYVETPFYLKDGHGATSVLQCDKLNKTNQMFIIASINKIIKKKYSYNNKATKIELKNTIISLPTINGKIDYEYMDNFTAKLENFHITKLETYLSVGNLNNHALTENELKVLKDFENDKISFGTFKIGDIFSIQNTPSFNKDKLNVGDDFDYVTRTSQNQGILQKTNFVNQQNINSAGNWSLGLLQMDFFYRHSPWYAGQFIRKITSKIELERSAILYFTVMLNKQKRNLLSVLVRDVDSKFLNSKFKLPINDNNKIDFTFLETFILAIQKLVIKDVVHYVDKKNNN